MSIRRIVLLSVFLCWITAGAAESDEPASATQGPLKVLLVGNSLTYTNSLGVPLAAFGNEGASPRRWRVAEQAMRDASLSQMWALRTTAYLLSDEHWDYIVLQERGNLLTIDPADVSASAHKFDEAAKKIGAKVILFENWRPTPAKQSEASAFFRKLGKELDAKVAPIGQAWQRFNEREPDVSLRQPDALHPTPLGTYIAACVIYLTIADAETCPSIPHGPAEERVLGIARESSQEAVARARELSRSE